MQECVQSADPSHRQDPHCTSSSHRPLPSRVPGLSSGAKASVASGREDLQNQQQDQQQGSAELSSMASGNASAEVPVLSFEIDDAEGPLEGASSGLAAQFGRLKVIPPAREASFRGAAMI